MLSFFNEKIKIISFAIISLFAYVCLAYFIPRENFYPLFFLYSIAFLSFFYIYNSYTINEKNLFTVGVLFRVSLLFSLPFWSQDFYRFIWDGRLILTGMSPYSFLPNDIIGTVNINESVELYDGMGSLSAQHYSNYPPVNQLFFLFAAIVSSKSIFFSVFVLKLIVLFADIGIYHFGKKILQYINLPSKNIFLYFLNPLIVIELSGNLHFEGVMLFFLVLGLFLFFRKKWLFSAFLIGLSISTKLLPLLLLPFFYQMLGLKKSFLFYFIIISLNILLFLPFISETLIDNYTDTIALWFVNFEFNASLYYIFRAIGYWIKGYNTIAVIGKIIPVVTIIVLLFFALIKKNKSGTDFFNNSLFALTIYFLLATTVHPWYIINLVVLVIFTRYKFAILWSFLIVLSYYTYSQPNFKENIYFLLLEYISVLFYLLCEFLFKNKKLLSNL